METDKGGNYILLSANLIGLFLLLIAGGGLGAAAIIGWVKPIWPLGAFVGVLLQLLNTIRQI